MRTTFTLTTFAILACLTNASPASTILEPASTRSGRILARALERTNSGPVTNKEANPAMKPPPPTPITPIELGHQRAKLLRQNSSPLTQKETQKVKWQVKSSAHPVQAAATTDLMMSHLMKQRGEHQQMYQEKAESATKFIEQAFANNAMSRQYRAVGNVKAMQRQRAKSNWKAILAGDRSQEADKHYAAWAKTRTQIRKLEIAGAENNDQKVAEAQDRTNAADNRVRAQRVLTAAEQQA